MCYAAVLVKNRAKLHQCNGKDIKMWDKFGEFDSYEEINRAAAAQKAEGDEEALIALALENGIDREDAEDYMDGCTEELCTVTMAALGKLKMEEVEYKIEGVLLDWVGELKEECMTSPGMAAAVRKKGKGLDGYIAALAESGYQNRATVDRRIVSLAPTVKAIVGTHEFSIGIPDKKTRAELARTYYLGEEKK